MMKKSSNFTASYNARKTINKIKKKKNKGILDISKRPLK